MKLLLLLAVLPLSASAQDSWTLQADKIDPSNYYGVTVANGVLGILSSPEPLKVKEVVLGGAFDLYGRGRVSNILKTFKFTEMYLEIDGARLDASNVSGFRQALDMRKARFTGAFDHKDKASVEYSYRALRNLPYTALAEVTVAAKKDLELTAASVMEAPDTLRDVQPGFSTIDRPHARVSLLTSTAKSPTGRLTLAASDAFLFDGPRAGQPEVLHEVWDSGMHLMKFTRKLKAGEAFTFSIAGSAISSAHHEDPLNEAERLTIFAALEGRDRLRQAHERAWDKLWDSDIVLEGDPAAQRDIRSALYHLYSFAREGTSTGLSPMGLSGLGYNGHSFWDTELWMFPPLLTLQPGIARSLVEYRYKRLPQARHNAFAHGFKGAMFPWESAESGNEETPVWALSGPFEHHITACVALAYWNFWSVTHDKAWLKEKGYPVLKDVADFWASRVERHGPGHYDIQNVVAADEWAENVDDNAFTNAAAKAALRHASEAARALGVDPDPDWETVAKNIPILKFPDGVTKEHAAYKGEPVKQADVNLLAYPLDEVQKPEDVRKDLEYYLPRMGDGPAMSHAILALLYERLGEPDKALAEFRRGYQPNQRPPFGVLAETATGTNPYFATGAGGMLQAVLNGFGGLEITTSGVKQLKTRLPKEWKSLTITGVGPEKKTFRVGQQDPGSGSN